MGGHAVAGGAAQRFHSNPIWCYQATVPILAIFFGVIIRIYHDDHAPPHFHVEYGEHTAIVSVQHGKLLGGKLPRRVAQLVEEWRSLHVAELSRAWTAAQNGKTPKRIAPLE